MTLFIGNFFSGIFKILYITFFLSLLRHSLLLLAFQAKQGFFQLRDTHSKAFLKISSYDVRMSSVKKYIYILKILAILST